MNRDILPQGTVSDILSVVREAGNIILSAEDARGEWGSSAVITKGGEAGENVNFVTVYDKRVQAFLIDRLQKIIPEAKFIGEEDDVPTTDTEKGYCFIIDPIDGTTNFIRGYRASAVSVGLFRDGKPFFGAILDPYSDSLCEAMVGCGARCNGKTIRVAETPIEKAVVHLGTAPYYKDELGEATVELFRRLLYSTSDVRRYGAAAIAMCAVAKGQADALFEARLSPWDYAAGTVIVREAGGVVSDFSGGEVTIDKPCPIFCSSATCAKEFYRLVEGLVG